MPLTLLPALPPPPDSKIYLHLWQRFNLPKSNDQSNIPIQVESIMEGTVEAMMEATLKATMEATVEATMEATVEAVVGVETGAAATEVAEIKALKYFVKIVYLYKVQVF